MFKNITINHYRRTHYIFGFTLLLTSCHSLNDMSSPNKASEQAAVSSNEHTQNLVSAIIDVNLNIKHSVGGHDYFDRQKYITIHATSGENDWGDNDIHSRNAPNADPNLLTHFVTDYDVYFGRETGSVGWHLRNLNEDPARPGFVNEREASSLGKAAKRDYNKSQKNHDVQARSPAVKARDLDGILGGQQHPYWPEGTEIKSPSWLPKNQQITPWSFSQTDTETEPLGTATGHYFAQYLSKFYKQAGESADALGGPKPVYFEIMNEPLYDLTRIREGKDNWVAPIDIFRFHNTVAKEIRKLNPDVLIGGYTAAFPDFDMDNFQRWEDRDKLFIDTIDNNGTPTMDFISIHLYDFPEKSHSERFRKGSNAEATMDMLERYTTKKFGKPMPMVISEYGAQAHASFDDLWNAHRDTMKLRGMNSLLMAFLERPNTIIKTVPFVVVKGEWGRTGKNKEIPHDDRLMIQNYERPGQTGEQWVYSDLVLFYDIWKEVKGTRVDSHSSDMDILVDAYVDGKDAYIILNNLEFDDTQIDLNAMGVDSANIDSILVRHLHSTAADQASVIEETSLTQLEQPLILHPESTMVVKISYKQDVVIDQTSDETKYYALDNKREIAANHEMVFNINNVVTGTHGEVMLRLGVGRDHGLSLTPTVKVNGTPVTVPSDFRGYDQKSGKYMPGGRLNFFGVLEVPVPYSALKANNTISVEFPDATGHVSSVALQVFNSSVAMPRTQ